MIAARMYGDIRIARAAEPRDQVIRAYLDTAWYHELPALLIGMIPIVFGCLTVDFHFGESQNAIETDKRVVMKSAEEVTDEKILMLTQEAERSATAKAADGAGVAARLSFAWNGAVPFDIESSRRAWRVQAYSRWFDEIKMDCRLELMLAIS